MARISNEGISGDETGRLAREDECVDECASEARASVDPESDIKLEPKTKWGVGRSGTAFWASHDVVNEISPGLYRCEYDQQLGPILQRMNVVIDGLIDLPDENTRKIVDHIEQFWKMKDSFGDRGFLHKRGILMYGDPGSGKTSAIQMIIKSVVSKGGIALFPPENPETFSLCIQMIRTIEKTKPIVAILEDFDTLTEHEYNQNQWLAILDGEAQTDNIVFLATTNYIDKLDKRFSDRPSRFDVIQPVPMPSALSRAIFLYHKEPSLTVNEIQQWVEATDGMSIAHLKEVIISVKCYGNTLDETIARLKIMHNRDFKMKDVESNRSFGFAASTSDEKLDSGELAQYIENTPRGENT